MIMHTVNASGTKGSVDEFRNYFFFVVVVVVVVVKLCFIKSVLELQVQWQPLEQFQSFKLIILTHPLCVNMYMHMFAQSYTLHNHMLLVKF
jgi:hypothetical protein